MARRTRKQSPSPSLRTPAKVSITGHPDPEPRRRLVQRLCGAHSVMACVRRKEERIARALENVSLHDPAWFVLSRNCTIDSCSKAERWFSPCSSDVHFDVACGREWQPLSGREKQVCLVSAKAECPNHPSRGGGGEPVGGGGLHDNDADMTPSGRFDLQSRSA